ncbi:MAG TPA: hypothetical protein VIV12_26535 [Streptosporangiaceae bacterium]
MRSDKKFNKGLRGEADLRQVGKNWQVRLNGEIYEFGKLDVPANIQPGTWWVELSGKGDKFYSIGPVEAVVDVKFARFGGKTDAAPTPLYDAGGPKTNPATGQEWIADPSLSMIAVLDIVGPAKYRGMTTRVFLPYLYVVDEIDPQFAKHLGTPKAIEKIEAFEHAAGLGESDNLPYSDNVLPALQALLQKRAKVFQAMIESGKVTKIMAKEEDKPARTKTAPVKAARGAKSR